MGMPGTMLYKQSGDGFGGVLIEVLMVCADGAFDRAIKATAPEAHSEQAAWGRQLASAAHALLLDWAEDCA
jgi:hypothetical protein